MAKWYERSWSGLKDVARSTPILGDIFGLDSPEEIAARRQQEALQQSRAGLSEAYAPIIDQYRQQYEQFQQPFEYSLEEDPGFQFAREQGLDAIQARLAAKGLSGSGREQAELAKYATGLAAQYAPQMRQQAFNERMQQQQMGMAGLSGLAGLQTGLAGLESGMTQQSGQIDAASRMAQAAGIRGMINQGIQAAGMAMGAPPGATPKISTGGATPMDVDTGMMYGPLNNPDTGMMFGPSNRPYSGMPSSLGSVG